MEFHEFLEVHKSKSNKSAWVNDIVLLASKKHAEDKSAHELPSSSVDQQTAVEKDSATKVEQKKKLSDLEASF